MQVLEIKGVRFGEGAAKTIISVMAPNVEEALDIIEEGKQVGVECFEWRGDFNDDVHDPAKMAADSKLIAAAVPEHPLLFTFRSTSQGGNLTISAEEYVELNKAIIAAEAIDMVDIETWIGDAYVIELVNLAHEHGIKTVVSYHNFAGTPSVEWMVNLMTHMRDMGADIPKVAVMALNAGDTLKLLAATEECARVHIDVPMLTMAMGREGSISRLSGELFGSAITFCSLRASSAPGQVNVVQAKRMMDDLHEVLS